MADLLTIGLVLGGVLLAPSLLRGRGGRRGPSPHSARESSAPPSRRARAESTKQAPQDRAERIRELGTRDRSAEEQSELERLLTRRNPMSVAAMTMLHARRNPSCPGGKAAEESAEFHGVEAGIKPLCFHNRPHVVLGEAIAVTYKTPHGSQRSGSLWEHKFLDRGDFAPPAKHRPLLVADAETERLELVGGDARFAPNLGIVG